jgi:hypothetical protein
VIFKAAGDSDKKKAGIAMSISEHVEVFIFNHLYLIAAIEIMLLPVFVAAFYAVRSKGRKNRLDRMISEIYGLDYVSHDWTIDRLK